MWAALGSCAGTFVAPVSQLSRHAAARLPDGFPMEHLLAQELGHERFLFEELGGHWMASGLLVKPLEILTLDEGLIYSIPKLVKRRGREGLSQGACIGAMDPAPGDEVLRLGEVGCRIDSMCVKPAADRRGARRMVKVLDGPRLNKG